jgi:2-polyprenyl-3-methyl-5-hydroxy-6-metoxy-1,4-benzoquinol methylase
MTLNKKVESIIGFKIERGETQKNVNQRILHHLVGKINRNHVFKGLDLPCGSMLFVEYLNKVFPDASIIGADLQRPSKASSHQYIQMDLAKDFLLKPEEKFDVITSVSGIMMFGNTLNFVSNCVRHLQKGGTFIITNDNFRTIKDKLSILFLGRDRLFKLIYEDTEEVTQQVPIQELVRLLRVNGMTIDKIEYTSFYLKDLIYLPIAVLIYPIQFIYLLRYKTTLRATLIQAMFPFKHYFCKHYIIYANKY